MKHLDLQKNKLLSTHVIPMRWVDMDAYSHMNNARYFDYMAEARVKYFSEIMKDKSVQYVLVHTECDFKKPLVYPKSILIKQYFTDMTRTTFTFSHTFHDEKDESVVYAIGKSIVVCVDAETYKPVIVPECVKSLLL
jgi:acyl-CoA thioester hydrolase